MASWNQCNAHPTADSSDTNSPAISLSAALMPVASTSDDPAEVDRAQESQKQNAALSSPSSAASDGILDERFIKEIKSMIPKKRQEALKWFGWGYKDSEFYVKNYEIHFRGTRYPLEDSILPLLTEWVLSNFNCTFHDSVAQPREPTEYLQPTINKKFLEALQTSGISHSLEGIDRLCRCHGQTMRDIYYLLHNKFKRIPDVVTWPTCHDDVVKLVEMANLHNVVIVPFGGGTSVSEAVTCPQKEMRMICILDTSQMNRMLWFNKANLTVCFEAGIVGQDLERTMSEMGMTVGHEPDSYEFSTLGGWVATRASGMKKNIYGNIEDLVVQVKMVTPTGVLERKTTAPRVSCGPDFNHVILGSEGTLGVVTEVVLKVRPLPPVRMYNCLIFPNFISGVEFMREVAGRRCQPASIRLMDNPQFAMGQTLKPPKTFKDTVADYMKHKYLTVFKGIAMDQICAATLLFEGEAGDVSRQESLIISIAKKHKGFAAGAKNGERGYILTFVIAYLRDLGLQFDIASESFETSVPWDRCEHMCRNVKKRVELECHARSVKYFTMSCRVTQTYDAGACVYFYLAMNYKGFGNPLQLYESVETAAREEVLFCGGSISHHHGVGKIRSRWYKSTVSEAGAELYKATKRQLDPKNVFAISNILSPEDYSTIAAKEESAVGASETTTANRKMAKL